MEYVKLKEVCEISMGQSPDSSSYNKEMIGVPFFQGNADFGEKNPDVRAWTTKPRKMALINDILISVRAPIGALNYANKNCCIGRGLASIRPIKDFYLKEYIFYLLKSKKDELNKLGTGSTFKAINKSVLENLKVPILNVNDQTKIVKQLDMIKHIIKKEKTQISFFDNLIKSRFVEMFGDVVVNEKGFITRNLGTVAPIQGSKTDIVPEDVWLLNLDMIESNTGNILKKVFVNKNEIGTSTCMFNENNVLYSKLRPYLNKVVLPDQIGFATSELLPLLPKKEFINREYLAYSLRSDSFVRMINEKVVGAKMPRVTTNEFKQFGLPIPPIELQYQFAYFVEQVNKSKFIVDLIRILMEMVDSNCFPN